MPIRRLPLTLIPLLLAACQAAPTGFGTAPSFQLAALGTSSAPVAATAFVPADGPALPAAQAGTLTVHFGQALPARKLMATLADVEQVTITLKGAGVDVTHTVLKAQLTSGAVSHTFTGLPPGALEVTIRALDASNQVIGHVIQQATVTAGQTTTVAATLNLAPPAPAPREVPFTPPPSGGSGGGGSPSTGSLQADVTIVDGQAVPAATYVGSHFPPADQLLAPMATLTMLGQLDVDADGNLWTMWAGLGGQARTIAQISKAGVVTQHPSSQYYTSFQRQPGATRMFAFGEFGMSAFEADGTQLAHQAVFSRDWCAVAPDGRWFSTGNMAGYATGAGPGAGAAQAWPNASDRVGGAPATDAAGNLYVVLYTFQTMPTTGYTASRLVKLAPDGSVLFERALPTPPADGMPAWFHVAVTAGGEIWVTEPGGRRLRRFSTAGAVLPGVALTVPITKLYRDPADRIWGYGYQIGGSFGSHGLITRFAADGTPAAYHFLADNDDIIQLAATADDHVWIRTNRGGGIHHFTLN